MKNNEGHNKVLRSNYLNTSIKNRFGNMSVHHLKKKYHVSFITLKMIGGVLFLFFNFFSSEIDGKILYLYLSIFKVRKHNRFKAKQIATFLTS